MRGLALILLLFALPVLAAAQGPPRRDRVRQMLSGFERTPTDAEWRRLGEAVIPVLIELSQDPSEMPFVRLRAVGATAAFPRPAVRTFLLAVARVEGQQDLMVREAITALARGFGVGALDDLTPFLGHRAPVVRGGVARALGEIGSPAASRALRSRLGVERDRSVRSAIENALR